MRTINELFEEYGSSHQHPVNVAIHKIAVPAITVSTLGMLWSLPFFFESYSWLNWASLITVAALLYYFRLSKKLALGFAAIAAIIFYLLWWLSFMRQISLFVPMLVVFVVAWVLQFVGHHIEGRRPSFMKDVQFLLIGPLWILGHFYRFVQIRW